MLDCKQLQVGDFCVATVPRCGNNLLARPVLPPPTIASGRVKESQDDQLFKDPTLTRSRSSSSNSNARKSRAYILKAKHFVESQKNTTKSAYIIKKKSQFFLQKKCVNLKKCVYHLGV